MWGRGNKGVGEELSQKAFSEETDRACLNAPIKEERRVEEKT